MSHMDRAKQLLRRHSHEEQPPTKEQTDPNNAPNQQPPQQAGGPPPQDNEVKKGEDSENTDNIKVEDNGEKEFKEENDLASLLKRIEAAVQSGGDPKALIDEWIKEKETKLKKWRRGLKSGAGVQTFSLGLVTFGLGPIPVNMGIMAGLNKHIVHTFTLDDERVDHFVKSTLGYGASDLAKKLGVMLLKSAVMGAGTAGATGIVPLIGPAISAGLTSHKISKVSKETTKNCAELSREICECAIQNNNFNI